MRNYFNSMKKIKFSLFFLLSVFGLCAQSPILVLEAENADSIHSPARVKSGDGFSNGKYVGGNDRGSYLFFHNVTMEKAGTYEFKTYFNCNGVRRFTVKVNNYPEVECTVNGTAKWDTPPAETAKALIYLAAGTNTIKITPYPTTSGGPNLDKFEILETSESPPACTPRRLSHNIGSRIRPFVRRPESEKSERHVQWSLRGRLQQQE